MMTPSPDLGSDDLKSVSYWITFAKPDFVATLQPMQDETIDYATDAGSFGGLKLAQFFDHLTRHGIPWPSEWLVKPGDEYPEVGRRITDIPAKDRKYLRVNIRVNWRQPPPDVSRERDSFEVLREIRDELGQ